MPERLIETMRSQASVETLKKLRLGSLMPALFTRMSTRPMRSAALATACLLPTSSAIASQLPSALIAFSAAARVSWLLPEITTCTPLRASSRPPARPIPEPPPVIQAVFPFNELASGILRSTKENFGLFLAERRGRASAVSQNLERLFHRRARGDPVAPVLEIRVVVDVHALALGEPEPRHDRHVGDAVFVARDPLIFLKPPVDDAVEAIGLVSVAVHRVFDLLGRVLQEVVRLTQHRPDVRSEE